MEGPVKAEAGGIASLQGMVTGVAYVGKRDTVEAAVDAIKVKKSGLGLPSRYTIKSPHWQDLCY